VERDNPETGEKDVIAAGRLTKARQTDEAEFAMLISDAYQGRGIGSELLKRLLQIGRDERVGVVTAYMLTANRGMRSICKKLGFQFEQDRDIVKAWIVL